MNERNVGLLFFFWSKIKKKKRWTFSVLIMKKACFLHPVEGHFLLDHHLTYSEGVLVLAFLFLRGWKRIQHWILTDAVSSLFRSP